MEISVADIKEYKKRAADYFKAIEDKDSVGIDIASQRFQGELMNNYKYHIFDASLLIEIFLYAVQRDLSIYDICNALSALHIKVEQGGEE